MLANGGNPRPSRLRLDQPQPQGLRLRLASRPPSCATCWPATRARMAGNGSDPHRPVAGRPDLLGFHDAWTVGSVGDHLLAVWIGNFMARPTRPSSGSRPQPPCSSGGRSSAPVVDAETSNPPLGSHRLICRGRGLPGIGRVAAPLVSAHGEDLVHSGKSPIGSLPGPSPGGGSGEWSASVSLIIPSKLEVFAYSALISGTALSTGRTTKKILLPLPQQCSQQGQGMVGIRPWLHSPLANVVYSRLLKPEETIQLAAAIEQRQRTDVLVRR